MEFGLDTVIAIILAGVVGCVATAATANALDGIPFKAIAASPGKQLWSVLFVIPVPFLLPIGGTAIGYLIAFLWLMLAPTLAAKFYFGPKDAAWSKLLTYHAVFAVVALIVYGLVLRLF